MNIKPVSKEQAKQIGDQLGIEWLQVDIDEFRRGLEVEQEHGSLWGEATNVTGDDPLFTGRIAWAHLKEIPDYYTRLDQMEKDAEDEYEEE